MDGGRWLTFELHVANTSGLSATITSVAFADDAGPPLATFEGETLARRLDAGPTPAVSPGGRRVVFVELALPPGATPDRLVHTVRFARSDGITSAATGYVNVAYAPPLVLGAPLVGGPWAAVHHPDWERGHRRVFYTVDGVTRLPGRFTIDFVRLDDAGRTATGDADVVSSALGYGAPVLAVADATVAAFRDSMSEVARVSLRRKHPQDEAAGNYVSLDIGNGSFAVYEHLRPGSIAVKVWAGGQAGRRDRAARLHRRFDRAAPAPARRRRADAVGRRGAAVRVRSLRGARPLP